MKTCRDVAWLVSSGELERQQGWDRWSVAMHLRLCTHCARLARQLRKIGRAGRSSVEAETPLELEERILQRLTKVPPK